jgi:hypothetical protein
LVLLVVSFPVEYHRRCRRRAHLHQDESLPKQAVLHGHDLPHDMLQVEVHHHRQQHDGDSYSLSQQKPIASLVPLLLLAHHGMFGNVLMRMPQAREDSALIPRLLLWLGRGELAKSERKFDTHYYTLITLIIEILIITIIYIYIIIILVIPFIGILYFIGTIGIIG